jgi:8-oxo-dGTP pyrophosphatase MutT (NUDIX family)
MAEDKEAVIVQKVVLAGIVMDEGRALVLQRSKNEDILPGMWELPSGKKEPLERWDEALVREMKEETGLTVEPLMPIDVFDYVVEKTDETRDTTQISFLVTKKDESDVVLSDEHDGFGWVSPEDLDKLEMSKNTRNAILSAFRYAK